MKILKISLSISLLACLVLISSCKEDEPILSRLELLTQKPWKLKSVSIVGFPVSAPESTAADDTYTFSADGSYTFDEGGTKEEPTDPQTVTGTWEFAENETIIKLNAGGLTLNQKILELSSTTLKVKFSFIVELEETFEH
jgi:hypothetical protein